MQIYISGRQFGKTTMLIKESARTGATIAVATYQMAQHVLFEAKRMGLDIPQPVTYAEIFRNFRENGTKRYLVDELQMMLSQLNVDIATLDYEPVRYLNHWSYPDGYSPKVTICDETVKKKGDLMEEFLQQINEYLESKIPDVPKSTRDEIATFLIYRFSIHEMDTVEKVNLEWRKSLLGRRRK